MPFLQVMSNRASHVFSYDNIGNLNVQSIPPGTSLTNLLQTLGIAQSKPESDVIDAIPLAIQHSIQSVIRYAVEHDDVAQRKQITFSWSPAYEHGVHIWEARAAAGSPSAITIHLEGPYPGG